MIRFLVIILLTVSLNNCSYEPILSNENLDFHFAKISSKGNEKINNIIEKNLSLKKHIGKRYEIFFTTKKSKEIVSSNEKGDATIYKLKVNLDYVLKHEGNELLVNTISKETTYNNITDKFELTQREENIIDNLSNNISSEILMAIRTLDR